MLPTTSIVDTVVLKTGLKESMSAPPLVRSKAARLLCHFPSTWLKEPET